MSQSFLLRKALTTSEAPILIAANASYFFRRIQVCNQNNSNVHVFLAVTAGRAFAQQGDWVLYHYDINGYSTATIDNLLVPDGHELRAYAGTASSISLVGSGIMEAS
jgi:hypothetical protein